MKFFELLKSEPVAIGLGSIGSLIVIIGAIWAFSKWGLKHIKNLFSFLKHFLFRARPHVPRETVRVLPARRNWWSLGSVHGKPAMQVVGTFYATNITDRPVLLLQTHIVKPRTQGVVSVRNAADGLFGIFEIPPGSTRGVSADFWIQPPLGNEGDDFRATIVFVDQYGNNHRVKNVQFTGFKKEGKKDSRKSQIPIESISAITDHVEKDVASVLKAEINRYSDCGRPAGGLGSIQATYRDHTTVGFGTEWREAHSPRNQSIVEDPEPASIQSDNAEALMSLYTSLEEEERERFVNALTKRLSRRTEYASVGYFILLVLFRVGRLDVALETAKRDLQGDDAFGFSDFLRMLDGLLRFDHSAFTSDDLDQVEDFLQGLNVETSRIQERISAIRSYRLRRRPGP